MESSGQRSLESNDFVCSVELPKKGFFGLFGDTKYATHPFFCIKMLLCRLVPASKCSSSFTARNALKSKLRVTVELAAFRE